MFKTRLNTFEVRLAIRIYMVNVELRFGGDSEFRNNIRIYKLRKYSRSI